MSAPKDRAAAPTRSLFLLSGVDALLFLVADVANLGPLLAFDGPIIPFAFAWTATLLGAAAASGFAGAFLVGRGDGGGSLILAGLANGTAVAAVAAYFALVFRVFGVLGFVFLFLAFPGYAAAGMAWKASKASAEEPFERI